MKLDIVITSDRTMITNHHGKEFLGFVTTGPPVGVPERLWMWICAPKPKVDRWGRPLEAPYGLRKIEAALVNAGFNAAIIDPDHLGPHLKHAKVLMIGHHDYFAMASPSIEWWLMTGSEPVNRRSFLRLMRRPEIREAKKRGLKIIAGGPAAWQWLWNLDYWREFGIDTVVDGEAEKVVVELAAKALNGEELPLYVYVGPEDVPSIEEIPEIKGASVNGLVEIMRGCPRGCKFCPVTLRPLRYYPLDKIERELRVNASAGLDRCILHSEDVLIYGARGLEPNPDALLKLHALAKKYCKTLAWSHATLAEVKYAQEKYKLITKLTELIYDEHQQYLGVQIGLETGSVNLAKKIMPAKAAPYPIEMWPQVVEDAVAIMHEHRIVPALTLILGLPEETEDDLAQTAELLDRLKDYRSLIVPMFFVPLGVLRDRGWFLREHLKEGHVEIMRKCLWHSLRWAEDIVSTFYFKGARYAPLRWTLKLFLAYVKRKAREVEKWLEEAGWEGLKRAEVKSAVLQPVPRPCRT